MNAEMTAKLSKYMMENGFYDTAKIRQDEGMSQNASRFAAIFGDDIDDTPEVKSEMLQAAEAHNNSLVEASNAAETAKQDEILSAETINWNAAETVGMTQFSDEEDEEGRPVRIELKPEFLTRRSELLNDKAETPNAKSFKRGQRVIVLRHVAYADQSKGATITPLRPYREGGFETVITAVLEDEFEDEDGNPVIDISYVTPMGNFSTDQLARI